MAPEVLARDMTRREALACVGRIELSLGCVRLEILNLYRGRGWLALGYDDWRTCVSQTFGKSASQMYRELAAAEVELVLSPFGEIGRLPETHARALVNLPPELQRIVHDTAGEQGPVTAAALRDLVRQLDADGLAAAIHTQEQRARAGAGGSDAREPNFPRKLHNSCKLVLVFILAHPDLPADLAAGLEAAGECFGRVREWLAGRAS